MIDHLLFNGENIIIILSSIIHFIGLLNIQSPFSFTVRTAQMTMWRCMMGCPPLTPRLGGSVVIVGQPSSLEGLHCYSSSSQDREDHLGTTVVLKWESLIDGEVSVTAGVEVGITGKWKVGCLRWASLTGGRVGITNRWTGGHH